MGNEAVIAATIAQTIQILAVSWAREIAMTADTVREMHDVDQPINDDEIRTTAKILSFLVLSLAAQDIYKLDEVLSPYTEELHKKSVDLAAANCQCPKHRAAKEQGNGAQA